MVVNTLGGVLEQCEDWTSDDRQIRHGTYSSGLLTLTPTTTFHDMLAITCHERSDCAAVMALVMLVGLVPLWFLDVLGVHNTKVFKVPGPGS